LNIILKSKLALVLFLTVAEALGGASPKMKAEITKEQIKALNPCAEGYQWYLDHGSPDLLKTLLDVNKIRPDWASWLYARLMSEKQRKQFAIYAAEEVLPIFEARFPDDKRPRKAIAAAKRVLKSNTPANRDGARRAAYNARDAANAAVVAGVGAVYAARAAYAGAAGVGAAATAAYANAANAAASAYAAHSAVGDRIVMQEKLIRKAVKILEKK